MPREDLVRLVSLAETVGSTASSELVLDLLLDRAIAWTEAERGLVVLWAPAEPSPLSVLAARTRGGKSIVALLDGLAQRVTHEVVGRGISVASSAESEGAQRSFACVPLRAQRAIVGALYVERRDRGDAFGDRDAALLSAIGHHAAVVLGRSRGVLGRPPETATETKRPRDERAPGAFGIIGKSRPMRRVFRLIEKLRGHDSHVLIQGPTGTGKELVARAIHAGSLRRNGPFVVESAGSLPASLVEAELFGYERGAFTGAVEPRRGAFERADKGTIFLDEVGDMPPRMQGLILRVLETGEVRPLGSGAPRTVDCRVIAASRHDLRALVREGAFREDLYFRLNVLKIELPPLAKRKEDVPALAEAFLREVGRPFSALSPHGLEALLEHDWPGNVRELKHAIERASLLTGGGTIEVRHLGLDGEAHPVEAPSAGRSTFQGLVLNRRQLALVDFLRANGVATNREYVNLVHVSVPTGWRDLNELVQKGVIRAEGSARATIYRLTKEVERELRTNPTTTTDGA